MSKLIDQHKKENGNYRLIGSKMIH